MIKLMIFALLVACILPAKSQTVGNRFPTGKVIHTQVGSGVGTFDVSCNFTDETGLYDGTNVSVGNILFVSDGGLGYFLPVIGILSSGPSTVIVQVNRTGLSLPMVPTGIGYITKATNYLKGIPFVSGISDADQQISFEATISMIDSTLQYRLPTRTVGGIAPLYTPGSNDSWLAQNAIGELYVWNGTGWQFPFDNPITIGSGLTGDGTPGNPLDWAGASVSGPISGSGTAFFPLTIGTATITATHLASSGVTAGSYTNSNITVDADGRITGASNGSGGGGGGGVTDGDKGDITISGSGTVYTIDPNVITNTKMADDAIGSMEIINASILGGDLNQMGASFGNVLTWNGSTWVAALPAGGGSGANLTITGTTSPLTLTSDTGTDVIINAGTGIITTSSGAGNMTITNTGVIAEVDGSISNEGSQTVGVGTGTTSVITSNTSGSTPVTITVAGIITSAEAGNNITLTGTEIDGSISNELQTISVATNTTTLSNGGGSMTVAGAGINVANTAGSTITITGTEIDGSISNEGSMTVAAGTGTTSVINSNTSGQTGVTITAGTGLGITEVGNVITLTNSSPDQTVAIAGAGISAVTGTYPSFTVTSTEIDGLLTNEGAQTVSVGTGTTSVITSNTSGSTPVTLTVAGIITSSESGNNITITAAEVHGSVTNEIQTISANGAGPTSYTIDNSLSGGSVTLQESTGIDLTRSGNIISIASTSTGNTDLSVSGVSSPLTLNSSTGTDVTVTAGTGISLVGTAGNITVNNTGIVTEVDGSITNEAWTIDGDDANTELITNQTVKFAGFGIVSTDYDEATNMLAITALEGDASITNENLTIFDGTNTENMGGQTLTVSGSGGAVVTYTPATNTLNINAGSSAGGDNWGSQVVEKGATLTGTGVVGNVLNVANDGITAVQIALDAVGASEIAVDAVGSSEIVAGAVGTSEIQDGSVILADMANVTTGSVFYRKTAGSGPPETNTLATLKTDLNLTGTNSGDQTITLTGPVTGSGTGSFATTIANNVITGANIALGADAQGDVMYYNGTDWARLGAGTSGQFLKTLGVGFNPVWDAASGGSGLTSLNAQTGSSQTFALNSAGTDFAIGSAANVHTFSLPSASVTNRGALTAADWATFNGKVGGSGTIGYLPKFTATGTLGLSKAFETSNTFSIGTNTGIDTYTRLYIFGGTQGANIDARGGGGGTDQAIFDAQSSDYATTFKSVHMKYNGPGALGTTLGQANANLGEIAFTEPTTALIHVVANTTPIRLGINGVEVGQISTNGLETRTGKTLRINDSDNTNYVEFAAPATGTLTSNIVMTLPSSLGSTGDVLTNNGAGVLAFTTPSGGATNLAVTGASSPLTLTSSTGTDVTVTGSGIVTLASAGTNIAITATEVDGSISNELQTIAVAAGTTTLSNSGGSMTIAGAGINSIGTVGSTITVTGTEVDGLTTNEGSLTVAVGTGTTSIINSNTSGSTGVTLTSAGSLTIAETGNVITLTGTGITSEVDGSITNELQTIANTSDATSHTTTLSNSGGSIKLVEGTGVTIATTGTGLDGIATITNSAPDQTVAIVGAGISVVTGTYPNFTVTSTEVDNAITNEGSLTVGAGISTTSIINSNTSGSTGVTLGVAGTLTIGEVGNVITLTGTGLASEVDGSVSNELQTIAVAAGTTTLSNSGGSMTIAGAGINTIGTVGSTITVTGTEIDGSVSNELQTVANSSAATTHTVTLSNSGGSLQLAEGANITLTTTGTGLDGVVTIASTGGAVNLTGPITSVGAATSVASQTGTGSTFVMNTSPTLVTPVIGAATGTSLSVSGQLTSTIVTGTPPLVVSSTTLVPNLNVATAALATTVTTNANLTGMVTSVGNATTVVTNANLTGDVTSVGNASTIAANAVNSAKIADGTVTLADQANIATGSLIYRKTAGAGVQEVNTLATLKTDLGLTGTNSGDQTITLTGDITGTGTGSFTTAIAANAVVTGDILDGTILNADLATMPASTYIGNNTGAVGVPAYITATEVTANLNLFTSVLKGLVPLSGGGTTNFLRADGTWAAAGGAPAGTNTQTIYYSGTTPTASSALTNNGTTIGVGTAPTGSMLTVAGAVDVQGGSYSSTGNGSVSGSLLSPSFHFFNTTGLVDWTGGSANNGNWELYEGGVLREYITDNTDERFFIGTAVIGNNYKKSIAEAIFTVVDSAASVTTSVIENKRISGTAGAKLLIQTNGDTGGDPFIALTNATATYSMGIDNSATNNPFIVSASGIPGVSPLLSANTSAQWAIGSAPIVAASLALPAGTTTQAPLRFTLGTNLTTPVSGTVEFDGTNFLGTNSTATRYTLAKTLSTTAVINFANTAIGDYQVTNVTLTGAADGDVVVLGVPNASVPVSASCTYTAWVSAANTVTVKFINTSTSGALDPGSGTFRVTIIKQ